MTALDRTPDYRLQSQMTAYAEDIRKFNKKLEQKRSGLAGKAIEEIESLIGNPSFHKHYGKEPWRRPPIPKAAPTRPPTPTELAAVDHPRILNLD